jgi:hypothetical protein
MAMRSILAVLMMAIMLAAPQQAAAQQAELTRARESFVQAYEAGNLDNLMAQQHPDATYAGTLQPFWLYGAEVRDLWNRYLSGTQRRLIRFRDVEVRLYADNVAVETGYMEMYMDRPPSPELISTFIRYSITRVRRDGEWLIVNMNSARLPGDRP